jgi:hypothetical protein
MSVRVRPLLFPRCFFAWFVLLVLAALPLACVGGSAKVQTSVPLGQPTFSHVVLVVEENHSYSEVIGNSSMPSFNGLVSQYRAPLMLTTGLTETFEDTVTALPQYSFIVPNIMNDAPTGTLAQADAWLQTNIAPLIVSSTFQSSGLLIITFDEGDQDDLNHDGGQVATLIIGSAIKKGFQSLTLYQLYQHQSALRLILAGSGVDNFPGMAATAPDMTEFFTGD